MRACVEDWESSPKETTTESEHGNVSAGCNTNVLEDIYTCPITKELMVDPVMAEDGHTYERGAIEKWRQGSERRDGCYRSPKTNIPMGGRIVPNHAVRQAIGALVECAPGDIAPQWHLDMGRLYMSKGQLQLAHEPLRRAARLGASEAYHLLAGMYMKKMQSDFLSLPIATSDDMEMLESLLCRRSHTPMQYFQNLEPGSIVEVTGDYELFRKHTSEYWWMHSPEFLRRVQGRRFIVQRSRPAQKTYDIPGMKIDRSMFVPSLPFSVCVLIHRSGDGA
jgi:hypothetical protein